MKEALIVGGSNGIGLAIVNSLQNYDRIYVLDKRDVYKRQIRRGSSDNRIQPKQFTFNSVKHKYLSNIDNVNSFAKYFF